MHSEQSYIQANPMAASGTEHIGNSLWVHRLRGEKSPHTLQHPVHIFHHRLRLRPKPQLILSFNYTSWNKAFISQTAVIRKGRKDGSLRLIKRPVSRVSFSCQTVQTRSNTFFLSIKMKCVFRVRLSFRELHLNT